MTDLQQYILDRPKIAEIESRHIDGYDTYVNFTPFLLSRPGQLQLKHIYKTRPTA